MKVLVDLAWLLYKAHHANIPTEWVTPDNHRINTTVIYGMMRMDRSIHKAIPGATVYYCIEPPTNSKHQDADYKAGRDSDTTCKVFDWQDEVLSMLALFPDNKFITAADGEADDVMYTMVVTPNNGESVYIYSADNDLLPCMDHGALIFRQIDKGKPIFLTLEYINKHAKFTPGLSPRHVPFWKTICGDSSDNIPCAIPRFPKAKIMKIIQDGVTCVEEFEKYQTTDPKILELKAQMEVLKRNERLVLLRKVEVLEVKPEPKTLNYFVRNYGLHSLRKYLGGPDGTVETEVQSESNK